MRIFRKATIFLLCGAFICLAPRCAWSFDEALVNGFSGKVSEMICSDGGAWLGCYRMEASECPQVADAIVKPCADEILLSIGHTLSFQEGVQTATRLLGCFNARFEASYGAQRLSTEECKQPPAHLLPKDSGIL